MSQHRARLVLNLPPEQKEAVATMAHTNGLSLNAAACLLIRRGLSATSAEERGDAPLGSFPLGRRSRI